MPTERAEDEITPETNESTLRSDSPRPTDLESASSIKPLDDRSTPPSVLPYSRESTTSTPNDDPSDSPHLSQFERRIQRRCDDAVQALRRRPVVQKVERWLRGPKVPLAPTMIKPFFPKIESFFARSFSPLSLRPKLVIPLFLIAWFIALTFLVRKSYFTSFTTLDGGDDPSFISGSASFWDKNEGCGLNGTLCGPFQDSKFSFRCPAQSLGIQLLNANTVGDKELIYQPLVVGGGDTLSTYRADSWICVAAIQRGLFSNERGGCGVLEQTGAFTNYIGFEENGVRSVDFDSSFPSSYRFLEEEGTRDCADLRDDILVLNVVMSFVFSFVIRPPPVVFFWVLFCMGFWHIALVSDPRTFPPDIATAFQFFLPALFVGWAFWRVAIRHVLPFFEKAILERTFWYLAGFWVGCLMNLSLSWIPLDQLTPRVIRQRPGGLIAVLVLAAVLLLVVLNQIRVIRRSGLLVKYLAWYALGAVVMGLLSVFPGYQFRFHHYFAAIILMPGTAFLTRPSALFQGFLIGMFLNGVGRWGFDTIFSTLRALVGDGAFGTERPVWRTISGNFSSAQEIIFWDPLPLNTSTKWDAFALLQNDVLVQLSPSTNYTIDSLPRDIPHYFRLAFSAGRNVGDFGKAGKLLPGVSGGSGVGWGGWVDPGLGVGG